MMIEKEDRMGGRVFGMAAVSIFFLSWIIVFVMWGCPQYNVYSQRMEGEAQLAHAHASRQVQIQDAESKLAAAKSLANAEIERARGIAEANRIVGKSLQGNEAYLRYLYIDGLKDHDNVTTIYVPTEGGLPILDSGSGPARARPAKEK